MHMPNEVGKVDNADHNYEDTDSAITLLHILNGHVNLVAFQAPGSVV